MSGKYYSNNHPMKKYRTILLLLAIVTISQWAFPAHVSETKAKAIAYNHLMGLTTDVKTPGDLSLVYTRNSGDKPLMYIFGYYHGFVIVSGDDRAFPVLGYSTEKAFVVPEMADTTPGNNFWGWLKSYEQQLLSINGQTIPAAPGKSVTAVAPLLTTTWGQGWPYNGLCPADGSGPGGHVLVGCVGVALAQILRYHSYPVHGIGSYGYQSGSYPFTFANFGGATYNWANMPNSVSTYNADVATINFHTAASCGSVWGPSSTFVAYSTGNPPQTSALWNYFGCAYDSLQYVEMQNYTPTQWDAIIQAELIAGRPVYYRGDGTLSHAWVCDGINSTGLYHFNWGWDGTYNGYYALTAITPGGNNLTNNQHAIIGIKPNDGSTLLTNTTMSGTITRTKSLAIPDSLTLTLTAGTHINLGAGRHIQVGGRLDSDGTASNPVVIGVTDTNQRSGGMRFTESIGKMANNDTSYLEHTTIEFSASCGLYCYEFGKVSLKHCLITHNNGTYGAGLSIWYNPISVDSTEISYNHATTWGGGIDVTTTNTLASIHNNNIHHNISDGGGGGVALFNVNNFTLNNNVIEYNVAIMGAGMHIMNCNPAITNNDIEHNSTTSSSGKGAGIYIENASPGLVGNKIVYNNRGGLYITTNSNPLIVNGTIAENSSPNYGGGIRIMYNSNPILRNVILYGNTAPSGSQVTLETTDCQPVFNRCNVQYGFGGFYGPGVTTYNIANYTNNMDTIPMFENANSNMFNLLFTSHLINKGDTVGISNKIPPLCFNGEGRYNAGIDMGAHEYWCYVPAQPGPISGLINPCKNSTQIYSITSVPNVNYNWTAPTGWNIIAGQGTHSVTIAVGSTAGQVQVTPSNTCGNGQPQTLNVTARWVDADAGTSQTIPYNTATTLNGSGSNGSGNYYWNWQDSTMINGSNNIHNPQTINLTSATVFSLIVTDVTYGCISLPDNVTISLSGGPLAVTAVADPNVICQGDSTHLDALASGGTGNYTYSWTSNPSGFFSTLKNPWASPTVNTSYTVVVNDGATNASSSTNVTVNYIPVAPNKPGGSDTVDLYVTHSTTYTIEAVPGADYYLWKMIPVNAGGMSSGNTTTMTVTWSGSYTGDVQISVKAVNACGESPYSTNKNTYIDFLTVSPEKELFNLVIYPNPNDGRFTISSDQQITGISLTDVYGRKIHVQPVSAFLSQGVQTIAVDCSNIPKGMYFAEVRMEKGRTIKKVVVR